MDWVLHRKNFTKREVLQKKMIDMVAADRGYQYSGFLENIVQLHLSIPTIARTIFCDKSTEVFTLCTVRC